MIKEKHVKPEKFKMRRSVKERLLVALLIIGCVLLLVFSIYTIVYNIGKNSLFCHAGDYTERLQTIETQPVEEEEVRELKDGEIFYQGSYYKYNEDLMTFLCMGVDSRNGITDIKKPGTAGQADALMLVVANPHTEEVNIVAVNRDSIAEIVTYDTDGGYAGTERKQITLQYAYGNGREKSCELMEQAVSKLFYGIPIHGYIAIDMKSIPVLNDAVGGVPVTVLEDMDWCRPEWTEGKEITLLGEDSLTYIRERNFTSTKMGTNVDRIARQKQYLASFSNILKEESKKDITFPIKIYQKIQKHMVTSLSVDQMTYLVSTLLPYQFEHNQIYNMDGELKMGEKNEEFYPDEDSMKNIVVSLFYEKEE